MKQKIIQIGSSAGVTIPKKELTKLGLAVGDEVKITVEPATSAPENKVELVALTQKLIKRHQAALDNLSQR